MTRPTIINRALAFCLWLLSSITITLTVALAQSTTPVLYPQSPLRQPIPGSAVYTRDTRIASIRQTYVEYSGSSCRVDANTRVPLVSVTVRGGTTRPAQAIPASCNPDSGSDAHMIVVNYQTGQVNEFWQATWNSTHTAITAGGNVIYDANGTGITSNPNQRTTAAGLSLAVGQVRLEDLPTDCDGIIPHALTMAVPASFLNGSATTGYVAPAVGAETAGTAGANGIAMGYLYAISRSVDVDSLTTYSPFSRLILRTIQTYGVMIADGGGQTSGNQAIGVFRNEPGALETACGLNSDDLIPQVQREIGAVIASSGLFRVTNNPLSTPASTSTPRATVTRSPQASPTVGVTPVVVGTPQWCGVVRNPLTITCP